MQHQWAESRKLPRHEHWTLAGGQFERQTLSNAALNAHFVTHGSTTTVPGSSCLTTRSMISIGPPSIE